MRVPTRERSFFVAPHPGTGRRDRRDERVPRFTRQPVVIDAPAESPKPEAIAEIPVEMATTNGDWDGELLGLREAAVTPHRLESLFEEARWERILRRHGLSDEDE